MSELIVEREELVVTVTMNRPAALNALSRSLRQLLVIAFGELDRDPGVRVIILTGAGERAFTAGLDLKELESDVGALEVGEAASADLDPVGAIQSCRKPVIGAVNGVAVTGGFELALACDVLIASRAARFADTHARIGVMPGWGLSQKLSRLIGPYRAKELSLSGNFVDAHQAERWGLVNRLVEPSELLASARKLALDMAQIEPAMLIGMKRLIDDGYRLLLNDALMLEQERSSAHNGRLAPDGIKSRRAAVQARGRAQ